jgi:hypothetical protein
MLGAYHGVDPSMGWLFAVGLGLQERRRAKVIEALFPIAIGHFISIGLVVTLFAGAGALAGSQFPLRILGAAALILFGIFRLIRPGAHPRWVAMRVNARELVTWSFLMATAHGAGLMLFPILIGMPAAAICSTAIAVPAATYGLLGFVQPLAIVLLHTGAMFLVMGTVALIVYEWVGLRILRSAWINLDIIWAGTLVAAGVLSLVI